MHAASRGAGDGIRTRDIQLGRLELYQLSYTRQSRHLRSPLARRLHTMVGRKGFEPLKPEGRQIYSLMRLAASLPPRVDLSTGHTLGKARRNASI